MPPRTNQGQSSFAVSQESQQVVCPLRNQDGTNCRKRCLGEKRYRSMQEHIRRAHPEHYIAKLPATEESFQLMISSPPTARPAPPSLPAPLPQQQQQQQPQHPSSLDRAGAPSRISNGMPSIVAAVHGHERDARRPGYSSPAPPRTLDDAHPMAATAAVALAQLHSQRQEAAWDYDVDKGDARDAARPTSSYNLPPIRHHDLFGSSARPRELLPSVLDHSPPGRSSTLPPLHRPRPRKSSVRENARRPRHEHARSRDHARRRSIEGRNAYSVEPPGSEMASYQNKRWEGLVEAANSARGDDSDRDLTPMPQSPSQQQQQQQASATPFPNGVSRDSYKASPLARALTPPRPPSGADGPLPFPSIESSNSYSSSAHAPSHLHSYSGSTSFPLPSAGSSYPSASESSPVFAAPAQIYCANCRRPSMLRDSYACTECISGFCGDCMYALSGEAAGRARPCPRCRTERGKYKPFQLDLR